MNSYSGYGEDSWIAENLKPSPGVFCEVGAFDGVSSSNTLAFEQAGWYGLCIEPVPANAAKSMVNRHCVTWCCAAGASGLKPFFVNPQDLGTGGLTRYGFPTPVVVCGLEELVLASGFETLDLLSIDTEGTELDVWNTRGRFEPGIVIIEFLTKPDPPRDKEIVARLAQDGYKEVHRTEANLIFTHV